MKKQFLCTLEKALLVTATMTSIMICFTITGEARASKYGTVTEPVKETVEETVNEEAEKKAQEAAAQHEEGLSKGTAGDTVTSGVVMDNGKISASNVQGCYNTRQFGGGVSVASEAGENSQLNRAVDLGPGESSYAYIMDSSCGTAAKGALYTAAASYGYPAGPILDINIGKKTAAGNVVYPDSFTGNNGIFLRYGIPSGYRMAGYEPAFICLLPDGTTELIPNLVGGAGSFGGIFVDHPKGVYMLTQVPAGSIKALHDKYTLKYFNSYFNTNYTNLDAFGPNV